MTNLLLSAHRRKRIEEEAVLEALTLLAKVPIGHTDVPESQARERMVRFALRFGLSAYDAAYLELSDRLQAPLHTSDGPLWENRPCLRPDRMTGISPSRRESR